jgi:hypothetical protein
MNPRLSFAALMVLMAACGGGDKAPEASASKAAADSALASDAVAFRAQQQKYADSIFNSAASARDVAKRLGATYEVGSVRLRDTVAMLTDKADCLKKARAIDPYVSGVATVWVNMSVIGSDVIRVQESNWTSVAGNAVTACINEAAKGWKFNSSFGTPKAYLVQLQFK